MPAWLTWQAVKRILPIAIPALLLALLWIQGQRMHSWKELARARGVALEQVVSVQKEQNQRIIAWAKNIEAKGKRIADNADEQYQAGFVDARSAAERYIAAHRVRTATDSGGTVPASPTASGDGPGVPAVLSSDLVMVAASDVLACSDAAEYALRAHNWAMELAAD